MPGEGAGGAAAGPDRARVSGCLSARASDGPRLCLAAAQSGRQRGEREIPMLRNGEKAVSQVKEGARPMAASFGSWLNRDASKFHCAL